MSKTNVLYVDDENNNLEAFTASFRRFFNVYTANSATEARELLSKNDIHVVFSDQRMPDETGVELFKRTSIDYPHQTRVLLTAYSDIEALEEAVNKGKIHMCLKKPWKEHEIKQAVKDFSHTDYQMEKNYDFSNIERIRELSGKIADNLSLTERERLLLTVVSELSQQIKTKRIKKAAIHQKLEEAIDIFCGDSEQPASNTNQ